MSDHPMSDRYISDSPHTQRDMQADALLDGWINALYVRMDKWIDGWMYGWMGGDYEWMDD